MPFSNRTLQLQELGYHGLESGSERPQEAVTHLARASKAHYFASNRKNRNSPSAEINLLISSSEDSGRPNRGSKEQIGPGAGIPVLGLDALRSAAYGPEAALAILIPIGLAGTAYILPISLTIIVLLSIVLLLSPDDRGISEWWRFLHRGQR
jgi:hypothetical protein